MFDAQFTEEKVAKEMEYFMRSSEKSYERTYGWAWLLKLQEQLEVVGGGRWAETLRPLASLLVARWAEYQYSTVQYSTIQYNTAQYRWAEYQPNLVYPLRVGTHTSTAFGLAFALDYTRSRGDELEGFEDLIKHNSSMFFLLDK